MNGRLTEKFSPWTLADLRRVLGGVAEVCAAMEAGGRADAALKRALRSRPELTSASRAALAELSLGIRAWERRLRWALGGGDVNARELTFAYLVLVRGEAAVAAEALLGVRPLVDRPLPAEGPARVAVECSMPDLVVEMLSETLGLERTRAVLQAMGEPGPVTVRARAGAVVEDLVEELAGAGVVAEPTPRSPWGLKLRGRPNIRGLAAWQRGDLEVQDEGSQAIALFCEVKPGERVLDRCAGRGGKSLALWAEMERSGRLVCTDVDGQRIADLRARAERAGEGGFETGLVDELALEPESFDVVLLDVPCSETGTFRRSPDLRATLRRADVDAAVKLQAAILDEGAQWAAPGGRLVYATCSLLDVENEAQVAAFLAKNTRWTLEAELRLWPDLDDTDGFYMARLRLTPSP